MYQINSKVLLYLLNLNSYSRYLIYSIIFKWNLWAPSLSGQFSNNRHPAVKVMGEIRIILQRAL